MITKEKYRDSILAHKLSVKIGIQRVIDELHKRAEHHDDDKLEGVVLDSFYDISGKFEHAKFGSKEYDDILEKLKPTLDVHYKINDHHPQHNENGISGMNLMSIVEMLIDWKSASSAYGDNTFEESMLINKKRFEIDEQLYEIMLNTAKSLGYLD